MNAVSGPNEVAPAPPGLTLVTRMMVAENPGPVMPETLMPGRPPDFCAAWRVAGHLEVTAASGVTGRAVTRLPGDRDAAWPPGMVTTALLWKARPRITAVLFHYVIQTHTRIWVAAARASVV